VTSEITHHSSAIKEHAMKMYFLRHGLADWPNWDAARDAERPLTDEGIKKMKVEAKAIERLELGLDVILSSPYTRARQTAQAVADQLGLKVIDEEQLAPGFDVDRLRDVLRRYPDAESIMLVGHEPSFSATISQLIGGGQIVMKKGSLARVDVDSIDSLRGELVWLLTSKLLA
jgi:phosphohistidine phosphatase